MRDEFEKKLEEKLKSQNLIKRKRIIQECGTLIKAMLLYINDNLSYQRLSDIMALNYGVAMSDTAWKKQILKATPFFFKAAQELVNEAFTKATDDKNSTILNKYHGYALDATNVPIEGISSDVIRVHTQYSLNHQCCKYALITDSHTAESTTNFKIEKDSIYTADRAYGRSRQLVHILDNYADFIVRFSPSHIVFYADSQCKTKINIHEKLSDTNFFTQICYIKYKSKIFQVKIIAKKKPLDKQQKSEKKARRKAQKNQNQLTQKTIDFSKWLFIVTSITDDDLTEDVLTFYRLRWDIELFFKRTKSLFNFHKVRHSYSKHRDHVVYLCFAVAFMICAFKFELIYYLYCDISEFNLFSLTKYLFS